MGLYLKDAKAALDYAVDWRAALNGASITASQWAVAPSEPDGVRITATFREAERTAATLEGGVPGRIYRVDNTVTRDDGRVDSRMIVIRVGDR